MSDRIIDGMDGSLIKDAVCEFDYGGWLISFSQVFKKPSVAIFKDGESIYGLPSVSGAIEKINELNNA